MGRPFISVKVIIMPIKSPLGQMKKEYKILRPELVAETFIRDYGIERKERLTQLEWEFEVKGGKAPNKREPFN